MWIWNKYTAYIKNIMLSKVHATQDVTFWSNNLFAETIIYILPFCTIALLPSLYFIIFVIHEMPIAIIDLLTVGSMLAIAFIPNLQIHTRKIVFIVCVYVFSCVLLYFVGNNGAAIIYLQVASVFFILIFPNHNPYLPVIINIIIVIAFCILIGLNVLPWSNNNAHTLGTWIAVSSNLIFLTLLECALIPKLIIGLQHTIKKEVKLQAELNIQKESLQNTLQLLNRKNEELEQFAYVASHDLQEPLRMVSNFVTQIKEKYEPILDDKGKTYISFAVEGAKKMRQTIIDLLNFSRVGRYDGELELINLNELLEEIKLSLQNFIIEKNVVIQYKKLPSILTYKVAITQVFTNLISNAIKYAKDDISPEIQINCKDEIDYYTFSVKDNGIGIEEEYFEKVFVIFQRLHTNVKYEGTGIGLSIVKKIIEYLGGNIWIKSELNEGTTFYFTLKKQKVHAESSNS